MRDLRPYFLGSVGAYGDPTHWACEGNDCRADQLKVQPHPQVGVENVRTLTKTHDFLGLIPMDDAYRAVVFRPDDDPHVPFEACMVAFRGCKQWPPSLGELETGMNMALESSGVDSLGNGPAAHTGIMSVFKQFEHDLVDELKSMGCKKVVTTGHSMGGCLATVAAWHLKNDHHFDVLRNISFQSPRCVNTVLAQLMDAPQTGLPSTRVSLGADMVSHLLPRFMDYAHPGHEIHLNIDDRVGTICDAEIEQALGQCSSEYSNNLADLNLKDHFALKLEHFQ